jgi:hypothetical protein
MNRSKYFLMGFIAAAIVVALKVSAVGAPVTNIFNAGDTAVAVDVNANFQELADRIDVNATDIAASAVPSYDYLNFIEAATVSELVYEVTVDGVYQYTEKRVPVYNGSGVGATLDLAVMQYDSPAQTTLTSESKLMMDLAATGLELSVQEIYDGGGILQSTSTNVPPIRVLAAGMIYGRPWADVITRTTVPAGGGVNTQSMNMRRAELIEIEDVTVQAGTFNACLKLTVNTSTSTSSISSVYMRWYCPSVGLTKQVQFSGNGVRVQELQSVL